MKGVTIPILDEEGLSISIKGTHNGRTLGYWLNSTFFRKKDKELFISELKKELDTTKFEEIIQKIEKIEKRHKNRRLIKL